MIKNIKAFTFDLDGTLLTDTYTKILDANIFALRDLKEKGYKIIIATGRPFYDIVEIIKTYPILFDYAICNNGAYIYHVAKKLFEYHDFLNTKTIKQLMEIGTKHNLFLALHTDKGVFRSKLTQKETALTREMMEIEWNRYEIITVNEILKHLSDENATQASLRGDKAIINIAYDELAKFKDDTFEITIGNELYLDVNPRNSSKKYGLQIIAKLLNIKLENIVSFGDSGNDVSMLESTGYSYAMGNATNDAKLAATEVIGSNKTNAIADTIARILIEIE